MPGSHHQEPAGEAATCRPPDRVHRLPGDQHRYHRCFARAGRHLQGEPEEFGVRARVCVVKVIPDAAQAGRQIRPRIPERAGDFDQPDSGLGRLDLAEEGTEILKLVVTPVAKETRGLRSHAPLRLREPPPTVHLLPDLVDDGIRVVLLFLGGQLLLPKRQPKLDGLAGLRLRGGHRGDELRRPAGFHNLAGRQPAIVEPPVPAGVLVGELRIGRWKKVSLISTAGDCKRVSCSRGHRSSHRPPSQFAEQGSDRHRGGLVPSRETEA